MESGLWDSRFVWWILNEQKVGKSFRVRVSLASCNAHDSWTRKGSLEIVRSRFSYDESEIDVDLSNPRFQALAYACNFDAGSFG